jgi:hypothetical protein
MDEEKLTEIGKHIDSVIKELSKIEEDDLIEFLNYVNKQDTVQAMFDPTGYRDGKMQQIDAAKRRTVAVKKALQQLEEKDLTMAEFSRKTKELG